MYPLDISDYSLFAGSTGRKEHKHVFFFCNENSSLFEGFLFHEFRASPLFPRSVDTRCKWPAITLAVSPVVLNRLVLGARLGNSFFLRQAKMRIGN
jgi:hypothetical protein